VNKSLYVDGAAHHGASVQGLIHDGEQVVRSVLGLVVFTDAAGEILHGLHGAAALQRLVAAVHSGENETRESRWLRRSQRRLHGSEV